MTSREVAIPDHWGDDLADLADTRNAIEKSIDTRHRELEWYDKNRGGGDATHERRVGQEEDMLELLDRRIAEKVGGGE